MAGRPLATWYYGSLIILKIRIFVICELGTLIGVSRLAFSLESKIT